MNSLVCTHSCLAPMRFLLCLMACLALSIPGAAMAATSAATIELAPPTRLSTRDTILGELPASQRLQIVLDLKLRNQQQLDDFLAEAGRPYSPMIQHRMSRTDFIAQHAPTQVQAQQVAQFLQAAGFSDIAIAPNRLLVSAYATPAVVEAAFATRLRRVLTARGEDAYANVSAVHIPAELNATVQAVLGAQTVHHARTMVRTASPQYAVWHYPTDFPQIYDGASLAAAAGISVGIITEGKMDQTVTDLNTFISNNGLPSVDIIVKTVGSASSDTSGQNEWNLDSQTIVGTAGDLDKLVLYTANSLYDSALIQAMNAALSDTTNEPRAVNMSFGRCESDDSTASSENTIYQSAAAIGITFVASSGDDGSDCDSGGTSGVQQPASSPWVVAVGGTKLNTTGSGDWQSETAWSGSGGGESTFQIQPSWQQGVVPGSHRTVPDIAFDADPNTGVLLVINGVDSCCVGGTSLSAPIFVGAWARLLQANSQLAFAAPYLYTTLDAGDYHDVTSGSNGDYSAGSGYDLVTGFGSLDLAKASADLAQISAPGVNVAFAPDTIAIDETSTLTITLDNTHQPVAATLTADLTDTLPSGLVVATPRTVSTTCSNATVVASAGSSSIKLQTNAEIPAGSSCTVSVNVTAAGNGTYQTTIAAGALRTNQGNSQAAASATLTVGNGLNAPIIGISPGSMHFDGSGSQTLTVSNNGGGTLDYDFDTTHYNLVGGAKPDDTFAFAVDDGGIEAANSYHVGAPPNEIEGASLWLNRFPTYGRLHLNTVSIYWPGTSLALGDLTGKQATLLIYYDADSDGDPGNATEVYSGTISIDNVGGFQDYGVSVYISAPGDLYIGFSDSWANAGLYPGLRPAAADTSSSAQGQSLNIRNSNYSAPDLTTLSNNDTFKSLGYNLMIRAAATSDYNSGNCASPSAISWLSVNPDSGSLPGGSADGITVTADATGLSPGGYSALLCIASNDSERSTVVVPITFTVPNQPPTADFTFTTSGLAANFTDASGDSDGSIASWAWDFGDGQTSTQASPSHTYAGSGAYTVKLTVTDNNGATGSISKSVTVYNPPVASFTVATDGLTATFTDTSTDGNGSITAWAWTFDDYDPSATSTLANPTYTYPYNGYFHVTLTVTDSHGNTGSTAQDVAIYFPPDAQFTFMTTALTADFSDTSTHSNGNITAWAWNFGDGDAGAVDSTEQNPSHTYASGGTYTVTLKITDEHGSTDSISHSVNVSNQPPTADFTFTTSGLGASFTDASSDSDGSVASWAWDFGDGDTSTDASPSHTYASSGNYTVTLTVTDNNGATGNISKSVTVVDCGDEIFADGFDGTPLTCP